MTQAASNPFFSKYKTPFETPPFNKIKTEHYEPAFDEGIKQLAQEVETIAGNPRPATFKNTIEALEYSGKLLTKVSSAFYNVLSAESNDEMMEISERISPKLSESSNNIYLNEKLFARVKAVYEQKDKLHLSTEEAKLLEETYYAFSVRGANLSAEDKAKYRELSTELSKLTLKFDQNVLKDENRYELLLTSEDQLAGLPQGVIDAAALKAKEKGKTGWMFTLSAPSYVPFMRYADNRELRKELYLANMAVGNKGDEYDNKENIKNIVNTRLAIARLMGYNSFAEYTLKRRMAQKPEAVPVVGVGRLVAGHGALFQEVRVGFAQHSEAPFVEGAVVHFQRVFAPAFCLEVCGGQQTLFFQRFQVHKIGVARKGRAALVGAVPIARGAQGQDLPDLLACRRKEIHKFFCLFAKAADPVGAGQAGHRHQNTTFTHCKSFLVSNFLLGLVCFLS